MNHRMSCIYRPVEKARDWIVPTFGLFNRTGIRLSTPPAMIQLFKGLIRASGAIGFNRATFHRRFLLGSLRNYSFKEKAKQFNDVLNDVADEKSAVSVKTMKYLRGTGAASIMIVIFLVMWASVLQESPVDVAVEQEILDLRKDIRKE